jgi:hypothetical protein
VLTNLRFIYQVATNRNEEGKDLEHKNGYESESQSEESDLGSEFSVDSEAWADPEDVEDDDMYNIADGWEEPDGDWDD